MTDPVPDPHDDGWRQVMEGRMKTHAERIGFLEEGYVSNRQRLHNLESDRNSVRLLVGTIQTLADRVTDMAKSIEDGIDAIAESAVERYTAKRSQLKRKSLRENLALVGAGGAAAGGVFGVIVHFAHLFH